jgi:hypothetical protein
MGLTWEGERVWRSHVSDVVLYLSMPGCMIEKRPASLM